METLVCCRNYEKKTFRPVVISGHIYLLYDFQHFMNFSNVVTLVHNEIWCPWPQIHFHWLLKGCTLRPQQNKAAFGIQIQWPLSKNKICCLWLQIGSPWLTQHNISWTWHCLLFQWEVWKCFLKLLVLICYNHVKLVCIKNHCHY